MNTRDYHKNLETFYEFQSWIFRKLGLWKLPDPVTPRYRLLHTIYFYYIFIFWVLSFEASCLIQLIINITDLDEVIKVFFIFATCLGTLSKFCTIKLKNHLYCELIETIHGPIFRPNNQREIKLFKQSEYLSRTVRNCYGSISICALHVVLVTPYFVSNNTELPLSIYNPMNMNKKWSYLMMYLYQYIAVSICCYMNIAFDSLVPSLLIHIKGQLDILCDRLENLGSEENHYIDNNKITLKLKKCIEYYEEIVRITRIVESLVCFPISIQIICSVLVLVANFYAMSLLTGPRDYVDFIRFGIYQLCMLSQIYILCYFSSEVTLKSKGISYHLYCSKWVEWNQPNRKLALLMMSRSDLPICIRSFNPTYTFNLEAFTSIVNSSYSYFALLKRINN